ncbi:MAG TPA: histidinol-phosphate transaminase [Terriglobales bacterium]
MATISAMLSRRTFFKTTGIGAAVAATASLSELFTWAEPSRAPDPSGRILLNSNENAYGPFPSVVALANPYQGFNRYPDRHSDLVLERLAAKHKVEPEGVIVGCGSTEILRIAANAFIGPGRKLVMASPTFEAMGGYAAAVGAPVVKVPLAANFTHNLGAMLEAAGSDAGLVYICNPNNPTGNITPRADLEKFIAGLPKNTRVLMDEAYHDFVPAGQDYTSFLDRPMPDGRIIVARTFSKVYGLAGMRLGYGIADKDTSAEMRKHRLFDSTNVCVLRCALMSLDDSNAHRIAVDRNAADRDEFMRQAAARKLEPIPSSTNFVMMETGRPIRGLLEYFDRNGIKIGRPFPPLDKYARISLGTPPEMKEFWRVWDGLPKA